MSLLRFISNKQYDYMKHFKKGNQVYFSYPF